MTALDGALARVLDCADTLPSGDAEAHVRTSVNELRDACARGEGVASAAHRVLNSIRQLQGSLASGTRRQEQHDMPAVERLLEMVQEELLPVLRREGLL